MSGDKINVINWDYYASGWGNRVKSQEVRYLYSEYFADDTSLCQMKLTSFSITTFFQKQEIGYQEAGCYDKASCFLSEERF
ncbi:hypothetical protein EAX94_06385 [Escherichia coli]|nr:hypothetical protein [Escherichia coli]